MIADYLHFLLIGVGIGLSVALAAAVVDYRLHLRRVESTDGARVPLLLIVGGFLGLFGLLAILVSLLAVDSIRPAIVMGIGVGIGFNGGFLALLVIWLVRERLRRRSAVASGRS